MQLQLSAEETTLLRDLLSDHLPALRREVARTEKHDSVTCWCSGSTSSNGLSSS